MYIRFPCFILLLSILLVIDSRGDTSGPLGIWYLNSNSYQLTATITAGSHPGAYRGTLVNENRGTEQIDNISWNAATCRIEFRLTRSVTEVNCLHPPCNLPPILSSQLLFERGDIRGTGLSIDEPSRRPDGLGHADGRRQAQADLLGGRCDGGDHAQQRQR